VRRVTVFLLSAVLTVGLALYALPALRAVVGSASGECGGYGGGYSSSYEIPCCSYAYNDRGYYLRPYFDGGYSGGTYFYGCYLASSDGEAPPVTSAPAYLCASVTSTATVTPPVAAPGQVVVAAGACFGANQPVTGELFSAPVNVGSAVADANGRYSLSFRVPTDAVPGAHRIVVSGLDPRGQRHESNGTLTVVTSELSRSGFRFGQLLLPAILTIIMGALLLSATRPRRRNPLL